VKKSNYSPNTYLAVAGMAVLWFCAIAVMLSMSSCSTPAPTSSREVIFRAKALTYSTYIHDFILSTPVYLVTVDSAYRSTDTVIWNNDRYVLLDRAK
jgi:hypothetical protein